MTTAASTIAIIYPDGHQVRANSAHELMDELAPGAWVWRLRGPESDPMCLIDASDYQRAWRASSCGSGQLAVQPSRRPAVSSRQSLSGVERALHRSQEAREAFNQAQQQEREALLIGGPGGTFQPDLGSKPGILIVKLKVVHGGFCNVPDSIYRLQVTRQQVAGSHAALEDQIGGGRMKPTRNYPDYLPPAEFTLKQGDFLRSVEVGTRAWIRNDQVSDVVARLRFTTSMGCVFEVGDPDAPSGGLLEAPPGFMITGFPCRAGGIIDAFGISCQRLP